MSGTRIAKLVYKRTPTNRRHAGRPR